MPLNGTEILHMGEHEIFEFEHRYWERRRRRRRPYGHRGLASDSRFRGHPHDGRLSHETATLTALNNICVHTQ